MSEPPEERTVEIEGKKETYTLKIQRSDHNRRLRGLIYYKDTFIESVPQEPLIKEGNALSTLQALADFRFSLIYKNLNKD